MDHMDNGLPLTDPATISNPDDPISDSEETQFHVLPENAILLYKAQEEKYQPPKPPPTPTEYISDCYVTVLPKIPDNVKNIEIPYVREAGIRDSIVTLAPHFNCNDHENNLVEFWFLDVIVDCIWRAQDEFRFPLSHQKWILEWILFVFKLIASNNVTKSLMFQIFNEAMNIAEDYIQGGGADEPIPSKLFNLNFENVNLVESSISSLNSSSVLDTHSKATINYKSSKQYIIIDSNEERQIFKLPTKDIMVDCLSSSVDSASDHQIQVEEPMQAEPILTEESEYSITDFCKVNMSTPPRFKSLESIKTDSTKSTLILSKDEVESKKSVANWKNIPRKASVPLCPSKLISEQFSLQVIEETDTIKTSNSKEDIPTTQEILKAFYNYNLHQLKTEYMANPRFGWTSFTSSHSNNISNKEKSKRNIQWNLAPDNKEQFIKSCVLMAVRQIVNDYFEYNFAFDLAKISLTSPQFLITQDVNIEWNIPKEIKGEVKKPMPKKPKKEKAKKEPKAKKKKDKSSKSSKKSKKSAKSKKDKKSKSDKKSKASKKSDKKSKSSKGDKGKKLSKEEKAELERQRKEQEEVEKELRKQMENKMFMFPLKEAVDDQFFFNLFPNYKPKKGGGKTKSEKSSKASKSSKSSKESKKSKGKSKKGKK